MTNVEVEIDGVKQKINKGQFEIVVKSILEKDYEDRWATRPFFKFLRTFYDKYLIKERTERYEAKLILEADEFLNQCKSFLALSGKK
jgi:ribonucleotide reductase alpha subunit